MKTLISQEDPNFARELKLRLVKFESDIEISFTTPYTSVFDFELRSFDLLILDEAVAVEKLRSQLQNIPLKDHPAVIYFFPPSQSEKGFEANRADFACVVTKSPENIAVLPVFIKQAMAQKKKMQRLTILNRQLEEADKAAFLGRIAAGLAHVD
ncbi:MAG: hypothetical protein DWQ10_06955 [Calditrichaeota bacterium]|nr:MAG: hypothetical protein DWQ10_06955 [Calditrichota bacterium]